MHRNPNSVADTNIHGEETNMKKLCSEKVSISWNPWETVRPNQLSNHRPMRGRYTVYNNTYVTELGDHNLTERLKVLCIQQAGSG